ncbi:hypothetical protein J31TS4_34410 [Paenibacillus sp. J31TS4]|uniref:phosphotransferase family protein n=1 Tax=Paenibacillus sp. J31TS4 TaxID=2807195 RepID=UPI001B1776B8|nr:phosphotransferase [Paenibacillus sp. J31TS4]GIP40161.1 hypothetical protein J31TS4_34410 [Paenibacillus sp. J31TS4]
MDRVLFERLLQEVVDEVWVLDPGYSGHASDVWLVKTASREVVVRSSRLQKEPDREFWWGCKALFGIDPREMVYFETSSKLLNAIAGVPAPRILAKAELEGREALVVERMTGDVLPSFAGQSPELLVQLGEWLARVHSQRCAYYGNLVGTKRESGERFHQELADVMTQLVERDYGEEPNIRDRLPEILVELSALPAPSHLCPILMDLDPSQFLAEQGRLSAIVDIEAYVAAPRELDFIGLEYLLKEEDLRPFLAGYTAILPIPELSACRKVYRYLYRLLGVQGSVDLEEWLAQPELF